MRNTDYSPSRFNAQNLAVTTIFDAKIESNPENEVGLVKISGGLIFLFLICFLVSLFFFSAECIVSLTHDATYLMRSMKDTQIESGAEFLRALDISMVCFFYSFYAFMKYFFTESWFLNVRILRRKQSSKSLHL